MSQNDVEVVTPHPAELYYPNFSIGKALFYYSMLFLFVFMPGLFLYEEGIRPGGIVNNAMRKHVYGQGNLWDYLAEDPHNLPYDDEVPECDWETMTPKRFFNDYVVKVRPCLFKNYGRQQRAFQRW